MKIMVLETLNEGPMQLMINDAFRLSIMGANKESLPSSPKHSGGGERGISELHHGEAKELFDLLKDGEQPLYDGCAEYSNLSFLVKLYHIKVLCRVSDKVMTMIIELLHDAFKHANIPMMQRNSPTRLVLITL